MTKLWQKGYRVNEQIERFEAAQNSLLDARLVRHDVWGSLAHIAMLARIGILTESEHSKLKGALQDILEQEAHDEFVISPLDEDVHTSVENFLTTTTGAIGKKIHMARSRNDQVLVDLRLYGKEQLHTIALKLCGFAHALLTCAQQHEWVPMPGYTHMQRAMLSSVGLWAASFAESLLDNEGLLASTYTLNDQSPLGSAAGYGVPIAIDRQYTSDLLGFSHVQNNVIYVQNSRGKVEGAIVQALTQIMLDLSKFAQDVLTFSTVEYGFFSIPQELCTGSSIMPQKRNLGVMELVRARTQTMLALQQQIVGIVSGLPTGYNMDYQETKRPFIEALDLVQESLDICTLVIDNIGINMEKLLAACTFELFATDRAYGIAIDANMPFRDAYRIVGAEVTAQLDRHNIPPIESKEQLTERLQVRSHLGGAGNTGIEGTIQRVQEVQAQWQQRKDSFETTIDRLVGIPAAQLNKG